MVPLSSRKPACVISLGSHIHSGMALRLNSSFNAAAATAAASGFPCAACIRARACPSAERLRLELAVKSPPSSPDDDVHDHVRHLISDLDEIDQEIIVLVYWEGFSLIEAARNMSLRPGTVRSRHSRARAGLRAALLETGDTT